jgi:hypothetical protein
MSTFVLVSGVPGSNFWPNMLIEPLSCQNYYSGRFQPSLSSGFMYQRDCCPNHVPAFWGRASRDIFFEVGSPIGGIRPNNGANFQIGVTSILQWAVQCVSEVNVRLLEHHRYALPLRGTALLRAELQGSQQGEGSVTRISYDEEVTYARASLQISIEM